MFALTFKTRKKRKQKQLSNETFVVCSKAKSHWDSLSSGVFFQVFSCLSVDKTIEPSIITSRVSSLVMHHKMSSTNFISSYHIPRAWGFDKEKNWFSLPRRLICNTFKWNNLNFDIQKMFAYFRWIFHYVFLAYHLIWCQLCVYHHQNYQHRINSMQSKQ